MGCMGSKVQDSASSVHAADPEPQTTPHLKQKISLSSPITCIDISEDLSMLVLGTEDAVLHVFSTMSDPAESLAQLKGHSVSPAGNEQQRQQHLLITALALQCIRQASPAVTCIVDPSSRAPKTRASSSGPS